MRSTLVTRPDPAYSAARMALVSTGFGLLLSAAVLSGSYLVHQQAQQPSLSAQLRHLRGLSTQDLDARSPIMPDETEDATVLATQAAQQTREMHEMTSARHLPTTHHRSI